LYLMELATNSGQTTIAIICTGVARALTNFYGIMNYQHLMESLLLDFRELALIRRKDILAHSMPKLLLLYLL